jgi:hypothetical protein
VAVVGFVQHRDAEAGTGGVFHLQGLPHDAKARSRRRRDALDRGVVPNFDNQVRHLPRAAYVEADPHANALPPALAAESDPDGFAAGKRHDKIAFR